MRVLFDTDVLVAAFRSDRGASRALLLLALDRGVELVISVPLVAEYEAVLTREEQLAASGVSIAEVGEVLDALVSVAIPVPLRFLWRPRLKDPADEMVLETAVNGQAHMLVTFNERHLAAAAGQFGVKVARPAAAWKEVRRRNEKE